MEERGAGRGAFDERAALEELERLREEIERRRAAREAAAGRFDAFIRSFQKPPGAAPVEPATAAPSTPQARVPPRQAAPPVTAPPPPVETAAPRVEVPRPQAQATGALVDPPSPAQTRGPLVQIAPRGHTTTSPPPDEPLSSSAAPRTKPVRTRALVASVLLLTALGALGVWAWRQQPARVDVASSGAAIQRSADSPNNRASEPPLDRPAAPAAAPVEPAPAPAASQLQIEITTTRVVWVRVLSDGERVLERELAAEARVPVTAKQAIVIRAGDAGAVRVSVAGGDPEPLGPGGQPITRTFTAGAREIR